MSLVVKLHEVIYLIHYLNSITRSCKTNLHRASIKTLLIKLTEYHIRTYLIDVLSQN